MWSQSFSSDQGIVQTSYHRIAMYIDVNELYDQKKFDKIILITTEDHKRNSISGAYGSHYIFKLYIDNENDINEINEKIKLMTSLREKIEEIVLPMTKLTPTTDPTFKFAWNDRYGRLDKEDVDNDKINLEKHKISIAIIEASSLNKLYFSMQCNVVNPLIMEHILGTSSPGASNTSLSSSSAYSTNHSKSKEGTTAFKKNFDLFALAYQGTREKTVDEYTKLFFDYGNSIRIGLGFDVPFDLIDWIVFKCPENSIKVITVGYFNELPNIYARVLENIHSRGANAMVILRNKDFFPDNDDDNDKLEYLDLLAEKYDKPREILFTKALIQLGYVVGIALDIDEEIILKNLYSLKHPFIHRRDFTAPSIVIKFIISNEDIAVIVDESEKEENINDDYWIPLATERKPKRELKW